MVNGIGATDRRTLLKGAALGAVMAVPGAALAKDDVATLRKTIAAGHDAAIKRLRVRNRWRWGGEPGGCSATIQPSSAMRSSSAACACG